MIKTKISLIIPTIEEETVFRVIDDAKKLLGKDIEIIIVDKSSEEYVKKLKKANVKVIRQKDKGIENALMTGFKAAKGSILASIDADGTHETRGLKEAVEIISSGKADFVLGNRLNNIQEGAMSAYLRFGNNSLSFIFSLIYGKRVHDVLTGLFVMDRKAFDDIKHLKPYRTGTGFFAQELAKRKYTISEVDIKYFKREYGPSKLTKSKLFYGFGMAYLMLKKRI
ncbi:MAG: glycosyltransferase family 2 protein [Candidatus Micrarchaeaceae archaeon]